MTSDADGLFNVYSDHTINGTIKSVNFLDGNYTATGSILVFASGLGNSGTALNELIMRFRAGSENQTFYPYVTMFDNQGVTGSFTNHLITTENIIHAPVRLVGSGLGDSKSGVGLIINYI